MRNLWLRSPIPSQHQGLLGGFFVAALQRRFRASKVKLWQCGQHPTAENHGGKLEKWWKILTFLWGNHRSCCKNRTICNATGFRVSAADDASSVDMSTIYQWHVADQPNFRIWKPKRQPSVHSWGAPLTYSWRQARRQGPQKRTGHGFVHRPQRMFPIFPFFWTYRPQLNQDKITNIYITYIYT